MIVYRGNVSKHFTQEEYHKGSATVPFYASTVTFVYCIRKFRAWLKQPMTVVSWLRLPAENKAVGGIKNSNHLTGTAMDFRISGKIFSKSDFINYAKKWNEITRAAGCVGEAGYYPTGNTSNWIHLGIQNTTQAKATGHKFVHWQTIKGKQTDNPFPELRGL